ncbi:50S ribosomal protein L38e [Candidatus Bathyarchaeota archaeon]|nr:50S ribosomal protein L38e [Candidatus Bathyarchaeota archaeon]
MPTEIFDIEKFIELSEKARYCIIKRLKDTVKLKLRTPKMLYTLKVDPAKAEEIIKQIKCEIREI